MCMHTYMHKYIDTYINTCIYTYMHTYIYTYIHAHIHIHVLCCVHKSKVLAVTFILHLYKYISAVKIHYENKQVAFSRQKMLN